MNDTFDRLGDLDLKSDTFGNEDLHFDMGGRGGEPISSSRGGQTLAQQMLMGGEPAPRGGHSLSEICDGDERDAVFTHTVQSGVLKNIHDSPLRDKLPRNLQMLGPGGGDASAGFRTFGRENDAVEMNQRFSTFEPTKPSAGLKMGADFSFNPKKFYCRSHPNNEVEFCNEINNTFYCRECQPQMSSGPDDKVLSSISKEV